MNGKRIYRPSATAQQANQFGAVLMVVVFLCMTVLGTVLMLRILVAKTAANAVIEDPLLRSLTNQPTENPEVITLSSRYVLPPDFVFPLDIPDIPDPSILMDDLPYQTNLEEYFIDEEPEPEGIMTNLGIEVVNYDEDVDYEAMMIEYLEMALDAEEPGPFLDLAQLMEAQLNLKRKDLNEPTTDYFSGDYILEELKELLLPHEPYYPYTWDELVWVASTIYREAGSDFATDEHQQSVASVIVNRVYSDKFPDQDTIAEVLLRPGQYVNYLPTRYNERCLENARLVLEYGPINDGLWQANFRQGKEVVAVYSYPGYPVEDTYICR